MVVEADGFLELLVLGVRGHILALWFFSSRLQSGTNNAK